MEEKLDARPHKLELLNREKGSVTGIQDVVSFDENQMILDTNMGLLTVRGKALPRQQSKQRAHFRYG